MKLTIEDIKPYLLFETISGSRSHNLATENSDTDIKGVFYLPKDLFYGLDYVPQIANSTNDIVYYELGRFVELLCVSNPNILELLNSPENMVLYRHPLMDRFNPEDYLSKHCVNTFVHYAEGQIKKAQGLNKKIINPVDKQRKSILDFCYIIQQGKTVLLQSWLNVNNKKQEYIGLAKLTHAQDLYAVYYDETGLFQGIIQKENANDVLLSSIPKEMNLVTYLSFNKEGYQAYCKQYQEYWQWVNKRNEDRYQQNIEHGRSYDSKNMMHTFRLLYMALGIAKEGKIKVWCDNREELLAIKEGVFSYDELLLRSNSLIKEIKEAFSYSHLPTEINKNIPVEILIGIREELYK